GEGGGGGSESIPPLLRGQTCAPESGGDATQETTPPFCADHVGSLLRPPVLKAAREKRERGEITPAQLKAVEDQEVKRAIKKQEEIGLSAISDGGFRPAYWPFDFLGDLTGCEGVCMGPP